MKIDIPLNDTTRLYLEYKEALLGLFDEVGESGRWVFGENTLKFSSEFAQSCGVRYCVPVSNGTDALELSLRALLSGEDVPDESEIVTVANAGGYTTTACRLVGAVPVYADVTPGSLLMDVESLKRCLSPKVKAVIVTHLYGGCVDVFAVKKALAEGGCENAVVIEDCSHAHGARIRDRCAGAVGDLAVFSFYPTKNLGALGDAGAVLTSNEVLFDKLRTLSQYGWDKKYQIQIPYGRNSRMDEIQAGALRIFLPHLGQWNQKRKAIYEAYKKHASRKLVSLQHGLGDYVVHLAVFRTPERARFKRFMQERKISTEVYFPVLDCEQDGWRAMPMRMDPAGLTHSIQAAAEVVSIPCFPQMTEGEVEQVCKALSDWDSA